MWLGHLIAMFAPPENCGTSSLATIGQPNDEIRMSKSELMTNDEARTQLVSSLVLRHSFVIGHFSFVIPIHFDEAPMPNTPLLHYSISSRPSRLARSFCSDPARARLL